MGYKKSITVTLEVKEIIFDIENKTHITGVSKIADGTSNYEAGANMQASDEAEQSYQLRRSVSNAFSHLKVELSEYLNETASTTNNRIKDAGDNDGQLVLAFKLTSNFDNCACDALGSALHEYIVDKAISEWYMLTNKAEAADYLTLASAALTSTRTALYLRKRPERPTYN